MPADATASALTCTACSAGKAGSIEAFRYSNPMKEKAEAGLTWTEEALRTYIANPKAVVPAGSMSYPGLKE